MLCAKTCWVTISLEFGTLQIYNVRAARLINRVPARRERGGGVVFMEMSRRAGPIIVSFCSDSRHAGRGHALNKQHLRRPRRQRKYLIAAIAVIDRDGTHACIVGERERGQQKR